MSVGSIRQAKAAQTWGTGEDTGDLGDSSLPTTNEECVMSKDLFSFSSGLLEDADVVVRDAIFANDPEYDNGQTTFLQLDLLVKGDDGGEQVERFSCGKNWETNDGGKTVVREDGKEDGRWNKNTKVARFLGGLVKLMGEDAACKKAIEARLSTFPNGPYEAGFWKGLDVHVARETVHAGGEIGDYEVLVIDGFNGIEGGKAAPAKRASKKAAATSKAAAPGGLTDEIKAKLDEIADASADHDSFMETALAEVPEASTDADVKAAVADNGEGSLWAEAVARYEALAAEG